MTKPVVISLLQQSKIDTSKFWFSYLLHVSKVRKTILWGLSFNYRILLYDRLDYQPLFRRRARHERAAEIEPSCMIETKGSFNYWSELAGWSGQLTNKKCHFCRTYDQSGHPSRTGLIWPETVLSWADLRCSIWGLTNLTARPVLTLGKHAHIEDLNWTKCMLAKRLIAVILKIVS